MLRDITLGQYYPGDSLVHRMDPRLKIIATFVFIISLFLIRGFTGYIYILAFLGICIGVSRIPLKFMCKGLKPLVFIIAITFSINMFMTKGEVIWSIGFLHITKEGVYQAIFMGSRLILLILGSSLLTLATKPIKLTDGIEKLLDPLKRFGVPSHELAMMMTIALRFIPTLLEETDKIMKAQMARGADFESGNLVKRAKSLIPLLIPLFISAFRRADELAMAMEARCYRGGECRTRMNEMKLSGVDIVGTLFTLLLVVLVILHRTGVII